MDRLRKALAKRPRQLHELIYIYLHSMSVPVIKLVVSIRDARNLRLLETNYARYCEEPNPYDTKDEVNPYQLRDDIRERLHPAEADRIIKYMQSKRKMPVPIPKAQAAKQRALAIWSTKARGIARQRLDRPEVWPSRYRSSRGSLDRVLVSKIKGWGQWVLDNYVYLCKLDNVVRLELGISWTWPRKSTMPGSTDDRQRAGDIELFWTIAKKFDSAWQRLRRLRWEAYYSHLKDHPTAGTKSVLYERELRRWEKVFTETKGDQAAGYKRVILGLIDRARKLKFN